MDTEYLLNEIAALKAHSDEVSRGLELLVARIVRKSIRTRVNKVNKLITVDFDFWSETPFGDLVPACG